MMLSCCGKKVVVVADDNSFYVVSPGGLPFTDNNTLAFRLPGIQRYQLRRSILVQYSIHVAELGIFDGLAWTVGGSWWNVSGSDCCDVAAALPGLFRAPRHGRMEAIRSRRRAARRQAVATLMVLL